MNNDRVVVRRPAFEVLLFLPAASVGVVCFAPSLLGGAAFLRLLACSGAAVPSMKFNSTVFPNKTGGRRHHPKLLDLNLIAVS